MTKLPQRPVGLEARPSRLRDGAGLIASGLAHVLVLLAVVLLGSPHLLATVAPVPIVVDIVRAEEIAKGKPDEAADAKQSQAQAQQQDNQQPAQPQSQDKQQQAQPQQQQPQPQQRAQPQSQPMPVSAAVPAAPLFASLYPWPVTRSGDDVQAGDYRTFESMGKSEHDELAQFKARLKECWRPPAGGSRKLTAALRVALRIDGSLAAAPELVEVSASPDAVALVASAKQALAACGPYGFLPAQSYDVWKALSLTFSPEDIEVAAVTR
jgi:biotin carboxyl carrier protein